MKSNLQDMDTLGLLGLLISGELEEGMTLGEMTKAARRRGLTFDIPRAARKLQSIGAVSIDKGKVAIPASVKKFLSTEGVAARGAMTTMFGKVKMPEAFKPFSEFLFGEPKQGDFLWNPSGSSKSSAVRAPKKGKALATRSPTDITTQKMTVQRLAGRADPGDLTVQRLAQRSPTPLARGPQKALPPGRTMALPGGTASSGRKAASSGAKAASTSKTASQILKGAGIDYAGKGGLGKLAGKELLKRAAGFALPVLVGWTAFDLVVGGIKRQSSNTKEKAIYNQGVNRGLTGLENQEASTARAMLELQQPQLPDMQDLILAGAGKSLSDEEASRLSSIAQTRGFNTELLARALSG
jgi:hypothetical protein